MINKNMQYGNTPGVTVVQFGSGTVKIAIGINESHSSVLFRSQAPRPVGETTPKCGDTSDDFAPEVALAFTNAASVRVLIEMLWKVELGLATKENTTPPQDGNDTDVVTRDVREIEVNECLISCSKEGKKDGLCKCVENKVRAAVEKYIKDCNYTHTYEDILHYYNEYYLKGHTVSHTTKDVIINALLPAYESDGVR